MPLLIPVALTWAVTMAMCHAAESCPAAESSAAESSAAESSAAESSADESSADEDRPYLIYQVADFNDPDSPLLPILNTISPALAYGNLYNKIVREGYERIAETTLLHGSGAIIFHGKTSAGKSSLIERLLLKKFQSIRRPTQYKKSATQENTRIFGDTRDVVPYHLEFQPARDNAVYVFDTPGFGEVTSAGQGMVLKAFVDVLNHVEKLRVPVIGIYLMVEATGRDMTIVPYLKLLRAMYGKDAARKVRIIVNKADALLGRSREDCLSDVVVSLKRQFCSEFGEEALPEKILFTCCNFHDSTICFGQLLNDLCIVTSDDFQARIVDIFGGRAQDTVNDQRALEQEIARLRNELNATPVVDLRQSLEARRREERSHTDRQADLDKQIQELNGHISRKEALLNQIIRGRRFQSLDGCFGELDTAAIIAELNLRCSTLDPSQGNESPLLQMVVHIQREFVNRNGDALLIPRRDNLQSPAALVLAAAVFVMKLTKKYRQDQAEAERQLMVEGEIGELNNTISKRRTERAKITRSIGQVRERITQLENQEEELNRVQERLTAREADLQRIHHLISGAHPHL